MASNPVTHEAASNRAAPRPIQFERICQLVALLMGAQCAFSGRYLPVGADGLAYLDLARAYVRHDWHSAANGYWGPLYAWLLAIAMRVFHPGIRTELPLARALNFAIYASAVYTFSQFWRAVADWSKRVSAGDTPIPSGSPNLWIGFGYFLFTLNFIWSVEVVNPDILVAAVVFAIGTVLFKLNNNSQADYGLGAYLWLGLLLAVGFYAKAILLYVALFVLGVMFLQALASRCFREPIIAALVFVVLVSPFVAILSREARHLTAGDSGKLNYAWFVDGPETKTWMRESSGGAPIPFYPGSVIFDSPRVFNLPTIRGVTYAPWFDAARFDKHSHPRFNLREQLRQLAVNLRYSREQLLGEGAALTVPLLIVLWNEPRKSLRRFAATWFCTLPALGIFAMYLLVHLVERFVLGFSLLLWGAAWASVVIPPFFHVYARRALLAGSIVLAAYTMPGLLHYVVSRPTESVWADMAIAEAIPRFGVHPGDAVAVIGDGQEAYWAHFAQLSVIDEIWSIDSPAFWLAEPSVQQKAVRAMADSGAKAVVWRADSKRDCPPQWLALPESSGCILSLR
jgi:hypothetical protein